MPRSAMEHVPVDYVAPLAELPRLLTRLAHEPITEDGVAPVSDDMAMEADIAEIEWTPLDSGAAAARGTPCIHQRALAE